MDLFLRCCDCSGVDCRLCATDVRVEFRRGMGRAHRRKFSIRCGSRACITRNTHAYRSASRPTKLLKLTLLVCLRCAICFRKNSTHTFVESRSASACPFECSCRFLATFDARFARVHRLHRCRRPCSMSLDTWAYK